MINKLRKVLIIKFLGFAFVGIAYGAPVITGISGTVQNGSSISISGSGFGVGKSAPLLWDTFENGANGSNVASTPMIGTWTADNGLLVTTAQRHSGTKSATALYSDGDGFTHITYSGLSNNNGIKYYQAFWFRYNSPIIQPGQNGAGQTKLMQLWGTCKGICSGATITDYNPGIMVGGGSSDWWSSYIALERTGDYRGTYLQEDWYEGPTLSNNSGWIYPARNTWYFFEAILKQSTPGVSDGTVILKVNGSDVYRHDPVRTRDISGQHWDFTTFFDGMTNWSGSTQSWVDDVYFNDTWARVMIGNAPTYSSSTAFDIQPATSWSDNSITMSVNSGVFTSGQTAYLYVFDANNVSNTQGFPITIGGSSNILFPPANLRIINN